MQVSWLGADQRGDVAWSEGGRLLIIPNEVWFTSVLRRQGAACKGANPPVPGDVRWMAGCVVGAERGEAARAAHNEDVVGSSRGEAGLANLIAVLRKKGADKLSASALNLPPL